MTATRKFRQEDGDQTQVSDEVQKQTKAYAIEIEKELKQLISEIELGPRYWREAELIHIVAAKFLWQIRGFESEQAYRETLMIKRASWFNKKRLWGDWVEPAMEKEAITKARLNRLPAQNVHHLLRLDIKRRFHQTWIEKAIGMKEIDFAAAVDAVIETGEEDTSTAREGYTTLKVRCTMSQKQVILDAMRRFAKANDIPLDDDGRILELAMAEVSSGLPTESEQEAMAAAV